MWGKYKYEGHSSRKKKIRCKFTNKHKGLSIGNPDRYYFTLQESCCDSHIRKTVGIQILPSPAKRDCFCGICRNQKEVNIFKRLLNDSIPRWCSELSYVLASKLHHGFVLFFIFGLYTNLSYIIVYYVLVIAIWYIYMH